MGIFDSFKKEKREQKESTQNDKTSNLMRFH